MSRLQQILGECRTYGDRADTHTHDYAQLILPPQGEICIHTPNQAPSQSQSQPLTLNRDRLFFLPPHCLHTFWASAANQFLVLDIPPQFVMSGISADEGLNLTCDRRWQGLRQLLYAEIQQPITEQISLLPLVQYANQLLQQHHLPKSIQYLQSHYYEPLQLATLAKLEGYNPTYYCDWFKRLTGRSPQDYQRSLRLQQAQVLLTQTNLPILQIAQQVGYEQATSLTRLFRQMLGLSPRQYRQQTRKSDK
ncbi:MAG: helix-turn-helix transcriptional regulator [Leptolyngbyaceae cyanobacterium SM1_1_3]|nr:helix-turn-helix transcriptional regulator [Leptolyngbyaceae cyanobacterium SM1_1_3]NJN02773.1 helix-turn-helix transcriptional regulator [Leptolyngbyaceae cyanobacterium RM1_1_2]NJO09320.1 helix-turn-helix transcriptional regulator [Leptolyngbyaceae cyanobacterium SL_1_1]